MTFLYDLANKDAGQRLRLLEKSLAHVNDIVMITEADLNPPGPRIIFVNEASLRQTGYSAQELIGQSPRVFQGPKTDRAALARIRKALEAGAAVREELVNYTKDGREIIMEMDIMPVTDENGAISHYVSIGRDITRRREEETEHRRLQEQLFQSQKMDSLSVLAGGIAHDFNNILTGIVGSAELAKMSLEQGHPAHADLDNIVQATQRAAALTKELLTYAGSGKSKAEVINLNHMVTSVLVILRSQMPKSIIVRKALIPDVPNVEVDPVQVQQVMMNLCLNASEAMREQGGVLTITTDKLDLDDATRLAMLVPPPSAGEYAAFEVRDTGCGMDTDTLAHVFEPFFSRRPDGRGLGLAVVLGIVKSHNGGLDVVSEPGQGTSFRVYLPASRKVASTPFVAQGAVPPGSQTVLFVDDEEMLRSLFQRALEHLGYRVLLAADGIEAVRKYREHADDIDLVVLDLSMPRQGGEDAFQEMRKIKPSVRVLLCCGYGEAMANAKIAPDNLVGFLPKPFALETLAQTIHSALRPKH